LAAATVGTVTPLSAARSKASLGWMRTNHTELRKTESIKVIPIQKDTAKRKTRTRIRHNSKKKRKYKKQYNYQTNRRRAKQEIEEKNISR
jgi:hypothetical protein